MFDYPTASALGLHLGASKAASVIDDAAASSALAGGGPASAAVSAEERRELRYQQALRQQYSGLKQYSGLQQQRPMSMGRPLQTTGAVGRRMLMTSSGGQQAAPSHAPLIVIESLVELSPLTRSTSGSGSVDGIQAMDPVGPVPLLRWDVEGGRPGVAIMARWGAFMPQVERFDAQVRKSLCAGDHPCLIPMTSSCIP